MKLLGMLPWVFAVGIISVLQLEAKPLEGNKNRVTGTFIHNGDCGCEEEEENKVLECSSDEFKCGTGWKCIPNKWVCDGVADCADDSDERSDNCTKCPAGRFKCDNANCVPERYRCDTDNDCGDGSDERNCLVTCRPDDFQCVSEGKCVPAHYVCDGDNDCHDKSDEQGCPEIECSDHQFECDNGQCVLKLFKCDGDNDCGDDSDEAGCSDDQNATCAPGMFRCMNQTGCVPSSNICDGKADCSDSSDEEDCPQPTCRPDQFLCLNAAACVPLSSVCDGSDDCGDLSDEVNCTQDVSTTALPSEGPTVSPAAITCAPDQFACDNGKCLQHSLKCDSVDNCGDGSDEWNCV